MQVLLLAHFFYLVGGLVLSFYAHPEGHEKLFPVVCASIMGEDMCLLELHEQWFSAKSDNAAICCYNLPGHAPKKNKLKTDLC